MLTALFNPMILLYVIPILLVVAILVLLPRVKGTTSRRHLIVLMITCILPMPFPLPLGGTPHIPLPAIWHLLWLLIWFRNGFVKYLQDTYGGILALAVLWMIAYKIIAAYRLEERVRKRKAPNQAL